MPVEEIIDRILTQRRDLTRESVLQMIRERVEKAGGLLKVESAARAVAAELGLEVAGVPLARGVPIRELISGLNNTTVVGRILHVNPPKVFVRPNGEEGMMRSLYIADETGILRVAIWGEKAGLLDSSRIIGRIIRLSHGYVRRGYDGRPELNIGSHGEIEIEPPGFSEGDLPPISLFFKPINQIGRPGGRVNTMGLITSISQITEFTREDESAGKMRRLQIRDRSGSINVVLWNNKVDELAQAGIGECLCLFGAKVREDLNGHLELHVDGSVDSAVLPAPPEPLRGRLGVYSGE
ncbi:MAG: single-stranded DNA-binding protein [Candidatus Bathyarchaeota archaeon B63]|nr:MAG: single-stranded DNA-binding protein [Candidatus Bathyarchaeota archaeon B63]